MRGEPRQQPAIRGFELLIPVTSDGSVLCGRRLSDDRLMAIKMVDGEPRIDDIVRSERLRTVTGHRHLVSVEEWGRTPGGQVYVVEEMPEAGSLDDWVTANGPLPADDVLEIGVKLAGALETVHRAGFVHGEVTPAHILISEEGEPQLAGLDRNLLEPNRNGDLVPSRDVAGLAAVLLFLLTGSRDPATADDAMAQREIAPGLRRLVRSGLDGRSSGPSAARYGLRLQEVQRRLRLPATRLEVGGRDGAWSQPRVGRAAAFAKRPVTIAAALAVVMVLVALTVRSSTRPGITPADLAAASAAADVFGQSVGPAPAPYPAFGPITDESGMLRMEVPTAWAAVDGRIAGDGQGRTLGNLRASSGPVDRLLVDWSAPGVIVRALPQHGSVLDRQPVSDATLPSPAEACTGTEHPVVPVGDQVTESLLYTGCGGVASALVVLTVEPPDRTWLARVHVVATSPRDLQALTRIVGSLQVTP